MIGKLHLRFLIIVFISLINANMIYSNSESSKSIIVNELTKPLNLDPYTYIYATQDTSTDVSTVLNKEFEYSPKGLNGINNNTVYWERFTIINNSDDSLQYYIYFPYSVINKLVAYSEFEGQIVLNTTAGMLYNKKDKVVKSIGFPIVLNLKPGETTVFVYIKHFNLSLRTTSFLLTKEELIESVHKTDSIIWFWKGFYLFAILITIIFYAVTRIRMFLYYFILNIGVGLFFSAEIGEISNFIALAPFNITANIKQTGVLLVYIMFPLLINQITPIARLKPMLWKTMFFFAGLVGLTTVVCYIPYFLTNDILLYTTYLFNLYAPFFFLVQMYFIFVAYKAKLKSAKILLIGYSIYTLAAFIYVILPNLGLLKQGLDIYNVFIYGSMVEIFMFMLLLAKETFSVYDHRADLLEKQKVHQSEIIKAIVDSQEKERNRVGRELHDLIGANISVIKQQIDKRNSTLRSVVEQTIESVRNLSHGLVTPMIANDEFVDEVNELCFLFSDLGFKVKSHFHNWNKIDNSKVATHIYRILQELLQNAVKHSRATEVLIQFIINKEEELTVMYEDDGIGFDYDEAYANKGLGLININNRVTLIGAKLSFDTMKGSNGTTVIISIPKSVLVNN